MAKRIEQITFQRNIPVTTELTIYEDSPFAGTIKRVTIHWPDGCDGLVDVKVAHGEHQFCPTADFLALNNATPTYYFEEKVEDHEPIWVQLRNTDAVNPHNITVALELQGEEEA